MISTPSISIIVPIFNTEKYIRNCAESLLSQTEDNLEFIFINDASTDNSLQELQNAIAEHPDRKSQIKIIDLKQNAGIANARNLGINAATGEYIGFCDSDDWVELDMYSNMLSLAKESNADIIGTNFIREYKDSTTPAKQNFHTTKEENISTLISGVLFPSLWSEIVKRKLYHDNNITFAEGINMGEDLLVNIKLFTHANKFAYLDKQCYHYRIHENSSCVQKTLKSIQNDIAVASIIDNFITEHFPNQYTKELLYRKFWAKMPLWNSIHHDYKKWKKTFPETNKHILEYPQLSRNMKIEYFLAAKGMPWAAKMFKSLLNFQAKIKFSLSAK